MLHINRNTNRAELLPAQRFTELGVMERQNIQEWIEQCPAILGEELLILAKEFDGFDDTKERLDLLALDTKGNLVVIENKREDSGRDVMWQSVKYGAYCSSLKKEGIVEIYARVKADKETALHDILAFLSRHCNDSEEVLLEKLDNPLVRLILVATNFRKEVTSSALWLIGFGLSITCVRLTPYTHNGELYVTSERIIPIPEAEELMIKLAKDKQESKVKLAGPSIDEVEFLGRTSAQGRASFEKLFAYANERGLTIVWGTEGFSLQKLHGGERIALLWGFPEASKRGEKINTTQWKTREKLPEAALPAMDTFIDGISRLQFIEYSGKEYSWFIKKKPSENGMDKVIDLIDALLEAL